MSLAAEHSEPQSLLAQRCRATHHVPDLSRTEEEEEEEEEGREHTGESEATVRGISADSPQFHTYIFGTL